MTAGPAQGQIKKGRASLVGGIVVGVCVFALWLLIARDLNAGGMVATAAGALAAATVATWIRLADL